MKKLLRDEINELAAMNVAALQQRRRELFGDQPAPAHRQFLFRKIAWRMGVSARRMLKALAEGETDPAALAALADRRLRATPKDLRDALGAAMELPNVCRRLLTRMTYQAAIRAIAHRVARLVRLILHISSETRHPRGGRTIPRGRHCITVPRFFDPVPGFSGVESLICYPIAHRPRASASVRLS